jgi:hypothetical protein
LLARGVVSGEQRGEEGEGEDEGSDDRGNHAQPPATAGALLQGGSYAGRHDRAGRRGAGGDPGRRPSRDWLEMHRAHVNVPVPILALLHRV